MPPVVRQKIGAPDLDALGGEIVLDAVGARQAGDTKERGKCCVITERGLHRCYSFVDLLPGALDRHSLATRRSVTIPLLRDWLQRDLGLSR